MHLPGVHGTSIGMKEVDGKATDNFAIRIQLVRKRRAGGVPAPQFVPRVIEGFPTDLTVTVMGVTLLEPNNMWNTMPAHTHTRRMEVYFYFDLSEENVVFHLMGEPNETRHLVVRNEQAVISPSWSIHSGMGTGNYAFIWAMAGENQTFSDIDAIAMSQLL